MTLFSSSKNSKFGGLEK